MELFAFIATLAAAFLGGVSLGADLNWPNADVVFAIATMGGFILWTIRHPKNNNKE